MQSFFDLVVRPLLEALRPGVVVEIGAETGAHTRKLLEACGGATMHVIDPSLRLDVDEWTRRHGDRLVFHEGRSVDALPRIEAADVVLVDGDHNWYTVHRELEIVAERADAAGRTLPLLILHDTAWPYGRRDLYYSPESIPSEFRHPYARRGMHPDAGGLLPSGGLNPHLDNAVHQGGPRNGVRTAVEDFVAARGGVRTAFLPVLHGLAVLADERLVAEHPALERELDRLRSKKFLRRLCALTERVRLEEQIQASERRLAESRRPNRAATEELERARLQIVALETRLGVRERDLAALEARARAAVRDEHGPELERARLELELEAADRARVEAELEQRDAELARVRAELDELHEAAATRADELARAAAELETARGRLDELEAGRRGG